MKNQQGQSSAGDDLHQGARQTPGHQARPFSAAVLKGQCHLTRTRVATMKKIVKRQGEKKGTRVGKDVDIGILAHHW